jgi:hypothetical protein
LAAAHLYMGNPKAHFNQSLPSMSTSADTTSNCTTLCQDCYDESSSTRSIYTHGCLELNASTSSESSPPHSTSSLSESVIPSTTTLPPVSPRLYVAPLPSRTSHTQAQVHQRMECATPVLEAPVSELDRLFLAPAMDTYEEYMKRLRQPFYVANHTIFKTR